MMVVCIEKMGGLTLGKIYQEVGGGDETFYTIINDNGEFMIYFKSRFKPLSDIREEKLNQIL